ncbi:MAG: OB-fold nucleic acid binding domain-containing protein, partial [Gemmatimonadota bacterium]
AREFLQAAREQGSFVSVEDVVRRSGLGPAELRVLAEAGGFESLWPGRREALWELLRQVRGDAGPLARRRAEALSGFSSLTQQERIMADYRCLGLSAEGHPMEGLRAELDRRGVTSAAGLASRKNGDRVRVAGLVICRQRPGSAKGVMFITLEDETGFANFVVLPDVGEEYRRTLRLSPLLELEGIVEREQDVINVRTRHGAALDLNGQPFRSQSRNFR